MSQIYLIHDYETRSEADLKKTGAWEYAVHPSTRILCLAYRSGTREELATAEIKTWSPAFSPTAPSDFMEMMLDPTITKVARNAGFEQAVARHVLPRYVGGRGNPARILRAGIPPEQWTCTAALAATHALPRSLEGTCTVLKLPFQKDMVGHRLMLKMSKPRKATKHNSSKWHNKLSDLRRLMEYCASDVAADTSAFLKLPPLIAREKEIWCLDQRINQHGFQVDRALVKAALKVREEEMGNFTREIRELTGGEVQTPGQRDVLLKWFASHGLVLENLQAKTVSDALEASGNLPPHVKRVLEIRSYSTKTSTKKYAALEARTRFDGRLRDILVYHAASPGRWGGSGFQPQNLPRGLIKDSIAASEVLATGDTDLIRLLYGEPMEVLSSCLRNTIVAPKGRIFYCGDYAAIEARKLFWLAKHDAGVEAFHNNEPMYEQMAAIIYNVPLEKVTSEMRFVGKQAVLGCGYGMGWKKFIGQCAQFGVTVTEEVAKKAVYAYRDFHAPVPQLWKNYERAAVAAVLNPGKKYSINHTTWYMRGLFLYCVLPSGRRLAYYGPRVRYENTPWGEKRPVLYHWGVDSRTKKWVIQKTWGGTLTENVCQAMSRDFMAEAMLRLDRHGYTVVLSVHDELLCEHDEGKGSVEEFCALMATRPDWAAGAPVKVEGWTGNRYRK